MSGYNRYKENSIYSMSGPELLFLIYDEAIKRLTRAEISLDDKNYADFEDCLTRTSKIVRYLKEIYDLSRVKAGRERRREEIGRIRHILSELKEAFEGANKQVNDMHMVKETEIRG